MEYLISMFIDDELDLDDKVSLVRKIRTSGTFSEETMGLLHQEKLIRSDVVEYVPLVLIKPARDWKRSLGNLIRPLSFAATGVVVTVLFMFLFMPLQKEGPQPQNRFVIYRPDVNQAEITGTFTDWKGIPLKKIGASGYWEISLMVPEGEHRYTYILEGNDSFSDPTILEREKDDFGGENSIILVKGKV